MSDKKIYWNDKEEIFIGSLDRCGDCCHGKTESDVLRQLQIIEKEWSEIDIVDQLKITRKANKESRKSFAKMLGIAEKTLVKWESGERKPTGPARSLLKVFFKDPEFVSSALKV